MQVKGVRLYAKDDIRLEEFELPEIKDDEILVKVMSDSICMSTWKMVKQGADHKRVPADVADHPIIIGHEFAGDIVKVGKKWQDKFKPGQKFAQQPAIPGQAESPGYSYTECGGAATYCIFPNDIIEAGCLWTHEGDSYFESSVAEPMCCVICGYKTNYHVKDRYEHVMGTKAGGSIDDMKEAIDRAARKEIKPAVMITHVGGIDSIVDTTMNLPNIPGGKKLSYLHINMPMTAISDLRSLAKDDPFFNELADICDRHNGLWSAEAEKALLTHYGVE